MYKLMDNGKFEKEEESLETLSNKIMALFEWVARLEGRIHSAEGYIFELELEAEPRRLK